MLINAQPGVRRASEGLEACGEGKMKGPTLVKGCSLHLPYKDRVLETSCDVGNYPKSRKGLERRIILGYAELRVLPSRKEAAHLGAGGFLLEFAVLWSCSWQHQSWWSCRTFRKVFEMILIPSFRSSQLFKETGNSGFGGWRRKQPWPQGRGVRAGCCLESRLLEDEVPAW